MLSRWPILYKLLLGVALLLLIVLTLSISGFRGVYAFRLLTKSVRERATELPLTADLMKNVSELRVTVSKLRYAEVTGVGRVKLQGPFLRDDHLEHEDSANDEPKDFDPQLLREEFHFDLLAVNESLRQYREQLDTVQVEELGFADIRKERETVQEIEESLHRLDELSTSEHWVLDEDMALALDNELEKLQSLTSMLPGIMTERMYGFAEEARIQYRTWIGLSWITTISAILLLLLAAYMFHVWIFRPLRVVIDGSRRVARGEFDHRIQLQSHDEVAELAAAMNDMTARFQEVRDDLDQQVKQRTKEVIRSEQLASVGFLAAGVAHEINNPMATIAWAAESLEDRMHDIILADDELPDDDSNEEIFILKKYLKRIQDEAFRCKGITERLLDYSRMGDADRQNTQLGELVENVIEMVRHLGKYREKNIEFECTETVFASVNPQELKQVVLNLLTNGLDCLDLGGTIKVRVKKTSRRAEIRFVDDGCGMTQEVREHLFEPFFTRRPNGQGTGLGLSITYRIIDEHGGTIVANSDGPGRGSTFRVNLPLVQNEKETKKRYQVA